MGGIISYVVLPDIPLGRLPQHRDLIFQHLQFTSGNERLRETLERNTVDMFGYGGDPRARVGNIRAHLPSHRTTSVLNLGFGRCGRC